MKLRTVITICLLTLVLTSVTACQDAHQPPITPATPLSLLPPPAKPSTPGKMVPGDGYTYDPIGSRVFQMEGDLKLDILQFSQDTLCLKHDEPVITGYSIMNVYGVTVPGIFRDWGQTYVHPVAFNQEGTLYVKSISWSPNGCYAMFAGVSEPGKPAELYLAWFPEFMTRPSIQRVSPTGKVLAQSRNIWDGDKEALWEDSDQSLLLPGAKDQPVWIGNDRIVYVQRSADMPPEIRMAKIVTASIEQYERTGVWFNLINDIPVTHGDQLSVSWSGDRVYYTSPDGWVSWFDVYPNGLPPAAPIQVQGLAGNLVKDGPKPGLVTFIRNGTEVVLYDIEKMREIWSVPGMEALWIDSQTLAVRWYYGVDSGYNEAFVVVWKVPNGFDITTTRTPEFREIESLDEVANATYPFFYRQTSLHHTWGLSMAYRPPAPSGNTGSNR